MEMKKTTNCFFTHQYINCSCMQLTVKGHKINSHLKNINGKGHLSNCTVKLFKNTI